MATPHSAAQFRPSTFLEAALWKRMTSCIDNTYSLFVPVVHRVYPRQGVAAGLLGSRGGAQRARQLAPSRGLRADDLRGGFRLRSAAPLRRACALFLQSLFACVSRLLRCAGLSHDQDDPVRRAVAICPPKGFDQLTWKTLRKRPRELLEAQTVSTADEDSHKGLHVATSWPFPRRAIMS